MLYNTRTHMNRRLIHFASYSLICICCIKCICFTLKYVSWACPECVCILFAHTASKDQQFVSVNVRSIRKSTCARFFFVIFALLIALSLRNLYDRKLIICRYCLRALLLTHTCTNRRAFVN